MAVRGTMLELSNSEKESSKDIVIITVLKEEFESVKKRLKNNTRYVGSVEDPSLYAWELGSVYCQKQERSYNIVVGMVGNAGCVNCALIAEDAIRLWDPHYIFLVGIAGGISRENLIKGDIVLADPIWGYEYGKISSEILPRLDWTYHCDKSLLNGAMAFSIEDSWTKSISELRPSRNKDIKPKVIKGLVASGDKVVDNLCHAFFSKIIEFVPKMIAFEMEGAGAAAVIEKTRDKRKSIGFLMIRSISDIPSKDFKFKNKRHSERDIWKRYAAEAAAAFAISYIQSGLPIPASSQEILSIEGTFEKMDNQYIAGPPLKSPDDLFVGRDELIDLIIDKINRHAKNNLAPNAVLLYGPRRTGKTSILYQLKNRLGTEIERIYIAIYIDLFGRDLPLEIGAISPDIINALNVSDINDFRNEPSKTINKMIDFITLRYDKKVILMFDEIDFIINDDSDRLEDFVKDLRNLAECNRNVFFIFSFCDTTSFSSNRSLNRLFSQFFECHRIGLLDENAAKKLILGPIKGFFDYSDEAFIEIGELSGRHPYFLQLICSEVVDWRNRNHSNRIPIQAFDEITPVAIQRGVCTIKDIWKEFNKDEKNILLVLSYILKENGKAQIADIDSQIDKLSLKVEDINLALQRLIQGDLVYKRQTNYYLKLGLIREWIIRYWDTLLPEGNDEEVD
jgi:nucleoside phosphorylase